MQFQTKVNRRQKKPFNTQVFVIYDVLKGKKSGYRKYFQYGTTISK